MLLQLSKTVKQSPKSPQIFENNGTFCADRPFSKNRSETNCQKSFVFNQLVSELQSYILSTTTETSFSFKNSSNKGCFNRTSFQQQLKRGRLDCSRILLLSFNRTSFQQQLKLAGCFTSLISSLSFNRTSFQQQLKQTKAPNLTTSQRSFNRTSFQQQLKRCFLNWSDRTCWLQSYILSTTTETSSLRPLFQHYLASIVHPFNNN